MFEAIFDQLRAASPEIRSMIEKEIIDNVSVADADSTVKQFPFLLNLEENNSTKVSFTPFETSNLVHRTAYAMPDETNLSREELMGLSRSGENKKAESSSSDLASSSNSSYDSWKKYAGWTLLVVGVATLVFFSFKYFKVLQRVKNLLSGRGFVTNKTAYERGSDHDLECFFSVSRLLNLSEEKTLYLLRALKSVKLDNVEDWYEVKQSSEARSRAAKSAAFRQGFAIQRGQ